MPSSPRTGALARIGAFADTLMFGGCTPSTPAEDAAPAAGSAAPSEAQVAVAGPKQDGIENLSASARVPPIRRQDQSRTQAGHSRNTHKPDEHQRGEYASQADGPGSSTNVAEPVA